jgi:hypothetical protein
VDENVNREFPSGRIPWYRGPAHVVICGYLWSSRVIAMLSAGGLFSAPGLSLTGVRLIIPDHAVGLPVLRVRGRDAHTVVLFPV